MEKFFWMAGGVLLVCTAFFIPAMWGDDRLWSSVITLYAVGKIERDDSNFRNSNGEIGKTEVAMYLFPETRIFEFAVFEVPCSILDRFK